MPYKDPEIRKTYMQEYHKKYREEHGERMNKEKARALCQVSCTS